MLKLKTSFLPFLVVAIAALLPAAAPAADSNCSVTNDPVCVRAAISGTMSARGSYKPAQIATIEYTVPIMKIKWSSWTLTRAVGRGRLAKCGSCRPLSGYEPGAAVTIVLQRPKEYFCGDDPVQSIGTWFTRAQVTSKVLGSHLYKIIGEGHPNAC